LPVTSLEIYVIRAIGILGGMGPEATAEFYKRIISIFQREYGCANDFDYPEIFIYNLPLPEIVRTTDPKVINSLQKGVDKLTAVGAEFIVSPCNSAGTLFSSLDFRLPFLSIVDETLEEIGSGKTGILGTRQTINSGVYQKKLSNLGKTSELPTAKQQEKITKIILNILAGKKLESDKKSILKIISQFRGKGCDAVILGCTELPLLISQKDSDLKLYDTLQILAEATVEYSVKGDSDV